VAVIKEKAVANAAAVWVGGVYIFCSLAFVLFPGVSRLVAQSWFHGFNLDSGLAVCLANKLFWQYFQALTLDNWREFGIVL